MSRGASANKRMQSGPFCSHSITAIASRECHGGNPVACGRGGAAIPFAVAKSQSLWRAAHRVQGSSPRIRFIGPRTFDPAEFRVAITVRLMCRFRCVSRYLDICKSIDDGNGLAEGHFLLGVVATSCSKYATAAGEFEAALEAAKACGNKEVARYSRIHIGMAKGKVNLAQQLVALDQQHKQ
jgi:hypothetical protein